jgi:glyoxylase-like metal-dependent hydrolase (beta-lactamase superfamily II)
MNPHPTLAALVLSLGAIKAPSCAAFDTSRHPVPADQVLARAAAAMGADQLATLQYSATGDGYTFGQAFTPTSPWPKVTIHSLTRTINYATESMRDQVELSRAEPLGGGAYPLSGNQTNDTYVSGPYTWNLNNGTTVVPFPFFRAARVHQLWVTPHGIIKAAQRNGATTTIALRSGKPRLAVTFHQPGALAAQVFLDENFLVERIESRLPDNLLGETTVVTEYSGYQYFGAVAFPTRIVQTQDGFPLYDLTVTDVQPNGPADIVVPDAVTSFAERATSTEVAPGVWFIAGGSHNSAVIEMSDHLILVESPLTDERGLAVLAEAARLVPGKPVKYVINSHNHFDHAGGLRAAVAAGAIVVTQSANKPYYEKAFSTRDTLSPDQLAASGKTATVEGVDDARVLSDGVRQVEIHRIRGANHCDAFVMIYLPVEKILIEADLFTPGSNPSAPTPAVLDPQKVVLVDNIERLGLTIDQILPLHGRLASMRELLTAVGKAPAP